MYPAHKIRSMSSEVNFPSSHFFFPLEVDILNSPIAVSHNLCTRVISFTPDRRKQAVLQEGLAKHRIGRDVIPLQRQCRVKARCSVQAVRFDPIFPTMIIESIISW